MARQFNLTNIVPSSRTAGSKEKRYKAEVVDRDWDRFTTPPSSVRIIGSNANGDPIITFPARKLVGGNVLDFDR